MSAAPRAFTAAGGELDVRKPGENNRLAHALIGAAVEAGHARNDDFNGERQDGFGIFDLNQRRGVRLSSSRAFLHPVLGRSNLKVFADTLVERINFNGSRAVGVTIRHEGKKQMLPASSEIVVAAGTVNSPQLLMLSGIGPADMLRRHNIPVMEDLPGVGANLQDHPTVSVAMSNPGAESYALSWRTAPRVAAAPFRYLFARRGMLASNAAEAGGFLCSSPELDRPDLQMTFMVGLKDNPRTLPRRHGFVLHVAVLRPATRGRLELASADPAARPLMHPNFLQDNADVRGPDFRTEGSAPHHLEAGTGALFRRRNSALVPRSAPTPISKLSSAPTSPPPTIPWGPARWGQRAIRWPSWIPACAFTASRACGSRTLRSCPTSSAAIPALHR